MIPPNEIAIKSDGNKLILDKVNKDGTYISKYGTEYEMKNTGFQIKKLLDKDGKFK